MVDIYSPALQRQQRYPAADVSIVWPLSEVGTTFGHGFGNESLAKQF